MAGVRRWFVVVVGLALACLGILALFQERTFPSAWRADAGPNGIDRALLIDTRGAPLEVEGGRDVRSGPPMGEAAPGYVVRIDASAGRGPSLTVRLVSPSGTAIWAQELATGDRAHLAATTLAEEGVWRLEVSAPGRIGGVLLEGSFTASPWSRVLTGAALPIAWIVCGLVAACAVLFGPTGVRVAAIALIASAVTIPVAHGSLWVFTTWPGLGPILGALLLLTTTAGLILGWSRPDPEGPPPRRADVVTTVAGAAAAVLIVVFGLDLPCGETYCLPLRGDGSLAGGVALAGCGVMGLGAYLVGRRSARPLEGTIRAVALDALGTLLVIASPLVLGFGGFIAIFAGTGIGLADQGPDPQGALAIAAITLLLTTALVFGALVSFRYARPERRDDVPVDPPRAPRAPRRPRAPVASRP